MALVTTPDGRTVYIPDFAAPAPMPPPAPPPEPDYQPAPESNLDFARGALSWDAIKDLGRDTAEAFAPVGAPIEPLSSAQRALSEKIAPPRTDAARIAQATGPVGTIGQIGQATPLDMQARGVDPTQAAAGLSQDLAQAQQAQQAQARQQALAQMPNTPEGQIQRGNIEAQDAVAAQQANARQQGETEGKEATDIGQVEQESLARANKMREEYAQQQAARQADIQRRQADIEKAVKAELDSKVDDNRRWNNLGTGQKVLAGIAVALSGLGDVLMRKSGPNAAIGMIQQAIKDDVDAQVRERESAGRRIGYAKSSLDSYRDLVNDETSAHKMKLSEEYDRTAQEIRVASSKYADDKAKLRGEAIALQLERDAATLRTGAGEAWFGRDVQREQLANQKRQTQVSAGHLGLAQRKQKFDEYSTLRGLDLQAAQLDQASKAAAAKGQQDQAKYIADHGIGGTVVAVTDENGQPVMGPDSKPVTKQSVVVAPFAGGEKLKELQTQKAAADTIINVLDETIRLREKYGWSSDLWASKEFREMKGNWAALKLELKDLAKLGVIAGPDEALMNDFLGGADPTSVRDPLAGLQNARKNVTTKYTNSLRSVNATDENGRPIVYDPPQIHYAAPVDSPEDVRFRQTVKAPSPLEAAQAVIDPGATPLDRYQQAETGITKAQRDEVSSLVQQVNDPKLSQARKDAAIARLQRGAESAGSPALRELFSTALATSALESIPVSKETP